MTRNEYEQCVYKVCDLLYSQSDYQEIITRYKVCEVFFRCTPRLDVPGYWMTDAMEQWGKEHGFELVYNVNKHNRRKNIALVKM